MDKAAYTDLIKVIDYHMDRYYNQDEPEISDYAYDQLMLQLKAAEREHPEWVRADSPTRKIGGAAQSEAGEQIAHHTPMLSILDVFTKEEIAAWVRLALEKHPNAQFSVEGKVDGVSLSLRYQQKEDGTGLVLSMAETRGTGYVGGNVLENARMIPDIQQTLPLSAPYLELRGEVYITREDFQRYLDTSGGSGEKVAANPRNLAAATLRQLDPEMVQKRRLHMLVFNVQDGPLELTTSHTDSMTRLAELGVPTVYHTLCSNAEEVMDAIDRIDQMRSQLPYDMDGVVVKLDHIADRNDFPAGPKYSAGHIAYKFPPEPGNDRE